MSSPEVSVVIGVYNGMPHLEQALESILSQEGVDLECIVVDDGSTDSTADLLAAVAASDPRVRVISQSNQGLTRALIRGCQEARGAFIARQDSDDLSLPGRLRAQRDLLNENPDLAFVSCWTDWIGSSGELLLVDHRSRDTDKATHLLRQRVAGPVHGSVMMRRCAYEAAGGYRSEFYYAQDNELWLRLIDHGSLAYVSRVIYCFRIHSSSISGSLHHLQLPFAEAITQLHQARMAGEPEEPILERVRALPVRATAGRPAKQSGHVTNYFIGNCLLRRRDPRSLAYLIRSLRMQPLYWRAWLKLPLALLLQGNRQPCP